MINLFGGISGGHFNPSVTTGVLVRERNFGKNLGFYLMIIGS
jgi:aquaporin Z